MQITLLYNLDVGIYDVIFQHDIYDMTFKGNYFNHHATPLHISYIRGSYSQNS